VRRRVRAFFYIATEQYSAPPRQESVIYANARAPQLEKPTVERLGPGLAQPVAQGPERANQYRCILDVLSIRERSHEVGKMRSALCRSVLVDGPLGQWIHDKV